MQNRRRPMHPYLELAKARLTLLVLVTNAVGFIAAGRPVRLGLFGWTLLGTGLAAAGANALNECVEAALDARMERTRMRPLPAHRLSPRHAWIVALASSLAGVTILFSAVNALTGALGLFVILFYVLVYTPMKRATPFCTLAGAVCGAIPPIMGWTGSAGAIGFGAWVLGLTLFLWQIPHFLALAWLYREDYERGGFRMLPSVDPSGRLTSTLAVIYAAALLPLGLLFFLAGLAGWTFLGGSIALGTAFLVLGLRMARLRDQRQARILFLGSIAYLPLLLGLFVLDRGPAHGMEAMAASRPTVNAESAAVVPGPAR